MQFNCLKLCWWSSGFQCEERQTAASSMAGWSVLKWLCFNFSELFFPQWLHATDKKPGCWLWGFPAPTDLLRFTCLGSWATGNHGNHVNCTYAYLLLTDSVYSTPNTSVLSSQFPVCFLFSLLKHLPSATRKSLVLASCALRLELTAQYYPSVWYTMFFNAFLFTSNKVIHKCIFVNWNTCWWCIF